MFSHKTLKQSTKFVACKIIRNTNPGHKDNKKHKPMWGKHSQRNTNPACKVCTTNNQKNNKIPKTQSVNPAREREKEREREREREISLIRENKVYLLLGKSENLEPNDIVLCFFIICL